MASTAANRSFVLGKRTISQTGTVTSGGPPPSRVMANGSFTYNSNTSLDRLASSMSRTTAGGPGNSMFGASGNALGNTLDYPHDAVVDDRVTLPLLAPLNRDPGSPLVTVEHVTANLETGSVCFSLKTDEEKRTVTTLEAVRSAVKVASDAEQKAISMDLQQTSRGGVTESSRWAATKLDQIDHLYKLTLPLRFTSGCPGQGLITSALVAGEYRPRLPHTEFTRVVMHSGGNPLSVSNAWYPGDGSDNTSIKQKIGAVWIGRFGKKPDTRSPLFTSSINPVVVRATAYSRLPDPLSACIEGVATSDNESPYGACYLTGVAYQHPGHKRTICGLAWEDAAIKTVGRFVSTSTNRSSTPSAQAMRAAESVSIKDRAMGKGRVGTSRSVGVVINPMCT